MGYARNTGAGGTNGTTVTSGSGGHADGSLAWDTATTVSGGTNAWDNTHVYLSPLSYKVATGATAGMADQIWKASLSFAPTFVSALVYFTANPTGGARVLSLFGGSSAAAVGVNVTASGTLQIADNGGTVASAGATIALNAWNRIELRLIAFSATVGQSECRLFTDPESTVPLETTTTAAARNTGTVTVNEVRFGVGQGAGAASVPTFWITHMQAQDTGYPPPPHWFRNSFGLQVCPPQQRAALIRAASF